MARREVFGWELAVVAGGFGGVIAWRRRRRRRGDEETESSDGVGARRDVSLELALEAAETSIWDFDIVHQQVSLDAGWDVMLGGDARPTLHSVKDLFRQVHSEDRSAGLRAMHACAEGRSDIYNVEYRVRAHDGRWRWIHSRGRVTARDESGRGLRMIGTNTNITRRKQAELAVVRQMGFLQALNACTLTALSLRERDEILHLLAGKVLELFAADLAEIAIHEGSRFRVYTERSNQPGSWSDQSPRDAAWAGLAQPDGVPAAVKNGRLRLVFPLRLDDLDLGALAWEWASGAETNEAEAREHGLLMAHTVALILQQSGRYTDAVREAEERMVELREQEAVFRRLIENIAQGFYTATGRGLFSYCNPAVSVVLGRDTADLEGTSSFRIVDEEDRSRVIQFYRSVARGTETDVSIDFRICKANGSLIWVEQLTHVVRNEDGSVREFQNYLRDITERRRAEEALRESAAQFRSVFTESPVPILMTVARSGPISAVNRAALELFEFTEAEVLGRSSLDLEIWPVADDRDRVKHELETRGEVRSLDVVMRTRSGKIIDVLYSAVTLTIGGEARLLSTVIDVTAQKHAEAALRQREELLRQAQKMESLGTLAGGVAHDFNNILTGVIGYAKLAKADLAPDHAVSGYMDHILKSGARARGLVEQILTFSRRTETHMAPVRVQDVVMDTIQLLRSTLPAMVQLEGTIDEACPPIKADSNQIHQVILNLCTNAWHALPEVGGRITVSLSVRELAAGEVVSAPSLGGGTFVVLAVIDNGSGMTAETLERIYEPFFTTKEAGKGTGLGLAVVHSIMEGHGGAMNVFSTPGEGATFELFFPALEGDVPVVSAPVEVGVVEGEGERILVVDDDLVTGAIVMHQLRRLNYEVDHIDEPHEALRRLLAEDCPYELIVTDLSMPKMSGDELVRALREAQWSRPVVLLSGFIEPEKTEKLRKLGVAHILSKPPNMSELAWAIHRALRV